MAPSQRPPEILREGDEFTLYRGEHASQPASASVLLLVPSSRTPSVETIKNWSTNTR